MNYQIIRYPEKIEIQSIDHVQGDPFAAPSNGRTVLYLDSNERLIYRVDMGLLATPDVHTCLMGYDDVQCVFFGVAGFYNYNTYKNYKYDTLGVRTTTGENHLLLFCGLDEAETLGKVFLEEMQLEDFIQIGDYVADNDASPRIELTPALLKRIGTFLLIVVALIVIYRYLPG